MINPWRLLSGHSLSHRGTISLLVGLLLLRLFLVSLPAYAVQSDSDDEPFWFDISLGAPLVDWFNQNARPYDIARVENISQLGMLDEIETGRRLVVFKSAAEAEEMIPKISDRLDIIGYNLEHGPANPQEEQDNPVAAVKRLRMLANEYGLELAVGPDRSFALSHGVAIAPYVDLFVLQVQKVQTQTQTVVDFVTSMTPALKQANPMLQVSMQIRTEGDIEALGQLTEDLRPYLDGLSVLTSLDTVDIAESLVAELNMLDLGRPSDISAVEPEAPKTAAKENPDMPAVVDALPEGGIRLLVALISAIAGAIGGAAITSYYYNHK